MFELLPESDADVIGLRMTGTLTDGDFQSFMPEFEKRVANASRPRILLDWEHLQGWDREAAANAFYSRTSHRVRFERLAIVGDRKWSSEAADMAGIFADTEVRLFPIAEREQAWAWLRSG